MTPARVPRSDPREQRLLLVGRDTLRDGTMVDLPDWMRAGDLLVVNDAATLPASLSGTGPGGVAVELRLAGELAGGRWRAVVFGEGDWRTRTEDRPAPPPLAPGDELALGERLRATVLEVDPRSPRLVDVGFSLSGAALWSAIYRRGHPIQYAHLAAPLEIWDAQTPFASRPWAVEMPSSGRTLTAGLTSTLRRRGVRVAALTHAAGLSSTGDAGLDASLPWPERFDLPSATIQAIAQAHAQAGRVIAVGTTVVRALEGCAADHGGELVAGEGTTGLRIDARFRLRVVDGILTGVHELGTSHRELLQAFAPEELLQRAFALAEERGYLGHEFGDAFLVMRP